MQRLVGSLAFVGVVVALGVVVQHQASNDPFADQAAVLASRGGSDPAVAVIVSDAMDGKVDGDWSCASMRYVVDRVPVLVYSEKLASLRSATSRTCLSALRELRVGASPSRVVSALGRPDKAPRCWLYRWPVVRGAAGDGARICFDGQHVARIGISQTL